ncbi:uncharacterized protein LOC129963524 isoform X2 [Argiope bruennichi]|uniref:uncharacterized protein LOC129963524 isoform X2 n=1 Tax=Argiope bruennichi TaxID=94029 RepID=UPI0024955319|nr:uncharacterized protein LOC129963524 isoform X2 [Argiope bruennichi]
MDISRYHFPGQFQDTACILVLEKSYSDRLYNLLERKCLFPEKYIEWLLTPHWKNVSLPTCIDYPINNIISKLQVMGHAIVSLNLDNSSCSVDILSAIICCVPNVKSLNLRCTYCTDRLLSLIRKMCVSLQTLNLSECKSITDAGMANLCNENKKNSGDSLKVLNILKTSVTQKGVILLLKHLHSIQWLSYEGLSIILYSLHKSDAYNNPVRYNLRNFEYNQSPVCLKHVLEVWTVMCPFVTRVCIQDKIDGYDLRLCKKFQCLKKLKIVNINYFPRETVISPFITLKGPMLTELEVMHATVSVELIVKLCYNLKKIFFFNVAFEDFSSSDLKGDVNVLNNLTSLTVKHLNFQRDFAFKSIFLLIKASKNLNELYIHFVEHFSNSLADIILELPKLTVVDFCFVDIEIPALLRFLTHENITKLRTDGCPDIPKTQKISDNQYASTCSWVIDYSEIGSESVWDCSVWSGEISS